MKDSIINSDILVDHIHKVKDGSTSNYRQTFFHVKIRNGELEYILKRMIREKVIFDFSIIGKEQNFEVTVMF